MERLLFMICIFIKKAEGFSNGDCFVYECTCIKKIEALSNGDCFVYDVHLHKENRSSLQSRLFCL